MPYSKKKTTEKKESLSPYTLATSVSKKHKQTDGLTFAVVFVEAVVVVVSVRCFFFFPPPF